MENAYLTQQEAMFYLNIRTYTTFNKLVNAGMPYVLFGKQKRFTKDEIDKFMLNHMVSNEVVK